MSNTAHATAAVTVTTAKRHHHAIATASINVQLIRRLPMCSIVGVRASEVPEAAEFVRALYLQTYGEQWPRTRIVVTVTHDGPELGSHGVSYQGSIVGRDCWPAIVLAIRAAVLEQTAA